MPTTPNLGDAPRSSRQPPCVADSNVADSFRAILEALPAAVVLVGDHRVLWINQAFTHIFGYSEDEALAQPPSVHFVDADAFERMSVASRPIIAQGGTVRTDLWLQRKNGERFWGSVSGRGVTLAQNEAATVWTLVDISERRRAEDALRASEERLEAAQTHALIGSWELGPNHDGRYWSRQMYAFFGFEPDGGLPPVEAFLKRLHPDDVPAVLGAHAQASASRQPCRMTYRSHPDFGEPRTFETTIVPICDAQGHVEKITGTTQDITERRKVEDALRRAQSTLEHAQAQARIGNWEYYPATGESFWSKEMFRLTGRDPNSKPPVGGDAIRAIVHPDDLPLVQRAVDGAIKSGKSGVCVHRTATTADGSTGYFETTVAAIRDPQGNVLQIAGTMQDITERVRLQDQLQQASKLEAIGRLAGGVAHDFNNLLNVVSGNVELALEEIAPEGTVAQYLSEVRKATSSAASLTRQLLAFSRRQLIEPKVVNLNELVQHLHKMLHRLIGEDIDLDLALASDLGSVEIDPGQFDQVIINLAINARDAMPRGGRLTLETANAELDEDYCQGHTDVRPGRFVMLAVTDTGEGMTEAVRSRIFEPFFSTKPQGQGTGLGLSVIFGAVKQAGGSIETYSELGHGTSFKIYLPRVDESARSLEQATRYDGKLRGSETILLVEDNDGVRELTTRMLRRLGYHVIACDNGKNALTFVLDRKPELDLLLTDLVMPEMGGRELSERMRGLYPDIAILLCSGYTEDTFVRLGIASDALEFIGKPFTMNQLGRRIRELLDARVTRNTQEA